MTFALLSLLIFCPACVYASKDCLPAYDVNEWPKEIVADVCDMQIRFESRSFWTLYRIYYKDMILGLDRFGSHYGTVANFPNLGFVGSGHKENKETEHVLNLQLLVDGKPVEKPKSLYACQSIELVKKTKIWYYISN